MWQQIFATATMNAFASQSPKATSIMWPDSLGKKGGLIRQGLLYANYNYDNDNTLSIPITYSNRLFKSFI